MSLHEPTTMHRSAVVLGRGYFTLAWALFRSAQYFFMRCDTALRAAADMRRVRFEAFLTALRTARLRRGKPSSGNVRSIAMISERSRLRVTSAPVRAKLRS